MNIKKYIIITVINIFILLITGCATTALTWEIFDIEHPDRTLPDYDGNYEGEYNGLINYHGESYYEYIYYNVLNRKYSPNIQILINYEDNKNILLNAIDLKKRSESNSILHYMALQSFHNVGTIESNHIYFSKLEIGHGVVIKSEQNDDGHIPSRNINLKNQYRVTPLGAFCRLGYIFTVPFDIVTSPFQLFWEGLAAIH